MTIITYELAGSTPKRNLKLVIEMSFDASPATEVTCRAERGWEKPRSLLVGFGVWQSGNGSEEPLNIFFGLDEEERAKNLVWTKKKKNGRRRTSEDFVWFRLRRRRRRRRMFEDLGEEAVKEEQ